MGTCFLGDFEHMMSSLRPQFSHQQNGSGGQGMSLTFLPNIWVLYSCPGSAVTKSPKLGLKQLKRVLS